MARIKKKRNNIGKSVLPDNPKPQWNLLKYKLISFLKYPKGSCVIVGSHICCGLLQKLCPYVL